MKKLLLLNVACLAVSVSLTQNFGYFASAVYLQLNNGTPQFYNCNGHGGSNQIGSVPFSGNLGTFAQNSGHLRIRGGEIKTWRNSGANVCQPDMYYRIYPSSSTPPSFTNFIELPWFCNCSGSSFPSGCGGGNCSGNDQKWQKPGSGSQSNIDLTTYSVGNYTIQVYFRIPGANSGTHCNDVVNDNNNGNYYTATFSITFPLPVKFSNISLSKTNQKVTVSWKAFEEEQFLEYIVERSQDGIQFSNIGKVVPHNSTGRTEQYSFDDLSPQHGKNFYRIAAKGLDGRLAYSSTATIQYSKVVNWTLQIWPNPVSDLLFFEIDGERSNYNVEIKNTEGKTLLMLNNISIGRQSLSVERLPAGTYILEVTDTKNSVRQQTRFVKL
ncbi:MAG: T9SS type A sorting domain-containing protein [Chitinophagaceae bacterium]|nr:T9SS type A sorting domain-containing protein [Chitinophagaceae bacterium]